VTDISMIRYKLKSDLEKVDSYIEVLENSEHVAESEKRGMLIMLKQHRERIVDALNGSV